MEVYGQADWQALQSIHNSVDISTVSVFQLDGEQKFSKKQGDALLQDILLAAWSLTVRFLLSPPSTGPAKLLGFRLPAVSG